jgi:hypothetical protein
MKTAIMLGLLLLLVMPFVLAELDFNGNLTDAEKEQFDQILAPLMKIYDFLKYAATAIGVLMFVNAGITFVTAGGEQAKKEKAKQMAVGVVIGLVLIWTAPLVVRYLVK